VASRKAGYSVNETKYSRLPVHNQKPCISIFVTSLSKVGAPVFDKFISVLLYKLFKNFKFFGFEGICSGDMDVHPEFFPAVEEEAVRTLAKNGWGYMAIDLEDAGLKRLPPVYQGEVEVNEMLRNGVLRKGSKLERLSVHGKLLI
jgi:hypothetical protein